MRILIAEDDVTSNKLLTGLLKEQGYEVTSVTNGAEAWQVLQQPDAPVLAILDWIMPEMDGLDVVRLSRALLTKRPPYIIILTSRSEKTDIITGLDSGANDYLIKPVDRGELRARVEAGRRLVETQDVLAAKIEELHEALDQIKTLRGILPICINCKKIRDDHGYWEQVEIYIRNHTEAEFTHGICPECMKKLYPELKVTGDEGGKKKE